MCSITTMSIEDKYHIAFAEKEKISIDHGEGVYVWDEEGKKYLDFTAGWAVTCLGYNHPVMLDAIVNQSKKIMHNPNSGLTYSPARAQLLLQMQKILPDGLHKMFFTNSGAEANDSAMKLARKITKRKKIISAQMSFHGRTLATASATGQAVQRDRFNVLVPNHVFCKFNTIDEFEENIDTSTAAVIMELIQGEGGVISGDIDFFKEIESICKKNGTLLIIDEVQTGFFRTGPSFLTKKYGLTPAFMTMAKGIAGGFPFGAVAVADEIAAKIESGDHGGTYIGNPLGCAVSCAVVKYLIEMKIDKHVEETGAYLKLLLNECKEKFPQYIKEVRGQGLLLAVEFRKPEIASEFYKGVLNCGLLLNVKHEKIIRIFPALVISKEEIEEGVEIMKKILEEIKTNNAH